MSQARSALHANGSFPLTVEIMFFNDSHITPRTVLWQKEIDPHQPGWERAGQFWGTCGVPVEGSLVAPTDSSIVLQGT